jgi:hypothetical protein
MSITASTSGSNSVSATYSYNNCCETAGCCLSGGGNVFYSSAGSTGASFCESFSATGTCESQPVTVNYSICEDTSTGTLNYLVEVGTDSYVVSGSYSSGSGTLTITGQNGTFTCTYTNHTGSCTGSGGTFTF